MAPQTIQALIADLARAFPRQPLTADTLRVYARELADLPDGALELAVRSLIRTSEFFPTVRAIREAAAELLLALPSEAAALSEVEAHQRWILDQRATGDDVPRPAAHPLVKQAVDLVGGWAAYRASEKPEVVRGQFLRLFRDLRAAAVRDHQLGPELQAGPRRPELGP